MITILFTALHATTSHLLPPPPLSPGSASNQLHYDVTVDTVSLFSSLSHHRRIAAVSMGVQLLTHHVEPQPTPWGYHKLSTSYQNLPGFRRPPKEMYAPTVRYSASSGSTKTELSTLSGRSDSLLN